MSKDGPTRRYNVKLWLPPQEVEVFAATEDLAVERAAWKIGIDGMLDHIDAVVTDVTHQARSVKAV